MHKTEQLRGQNKSLFISYVKPFAPVTSSTISRWIKTVMSSAGINVEKYKAHSVRSASSSKVNVACVPIEHILKVAGWSNAKTFAQFYNKELEDSSKTFSSAVLAE